MWRDEKIAYLRKNRDYARLLNGDDGEAPSTRGQNRRTSTKGKSDDKDDDDSLERQEYLDRRRRLKELERLKLANGKNGVRTNGIAKDNSTAGSQHNANGGIGGGGWASSKGKKELPYDRSFGSFFGPSEPVVARRIIEEARAREEAEIVASREASSSQRKTAKSTVVAKVSLDITNRPKASRDNGPAQRPPKPVVPESNDRARKLKEARDYSFLFDESQPSNPPIKEKHVPVPSKQGGTTNSSLSSGVTSTAVIRKPQPKNNPALRKTDRVLTSSGSVQTQARLSQASAAARKSTSGRPADVKVSATGPGRPDRQNGAERKVDAFIRKAVAGPIATASNRNGSFSIPRRPSLDKRAAQTRDVDLLQAKDRPQLTAGRKSIQGSDSGRLESGKRGSGQGANVRRTESAEKALVRSSERMRAPVANRQPSRAQSQVLSQNLRKGGTASDGYRPAAEVAKLKRQNSEPKLPQKVISRVAPLDDKPRRYSNGSRQDQVQHKRSRSMAEESDYYPRKKTQHKHVHDTSDDDVDSFIDDGEDMDKVSMMIRDIMGYNPSKYRDDFDDRSMEVGFHEIQREERRSAREAKLEDDRELALIEAEEKAERLRKAKKKQRQSR